MSATAAFDPRRDFFTPSERWCQDAASRFAFREGSPEAGVDEEVAAIQYDVGLRLWRFLATVARRAARLGTSSLRLASDERFEDDVAAAIGEGLGFEVLEDRDLLDRLATEFHTWLTEYNQGQRPTPWGALRATEKETNMEVVQLVSSEPLPQSEGPFGYTWTNAQPDGWETRMPRSVDEAVADPVVTLLQRLRQFFGEVIHRRARFRD